MKVLMICETASVRGGIERFVESHAALLREMLGHVVTVAERPLPGYDVTVVHKCANPASWAAFPPEHTLAVVHDHEPICPRTTAYTPFLNLCERPYAPLCCTACALCTARPLARLRALTAFPARLRGLRRLRRVVVLSDYMRTRLTVNGFDPARVSVVAPPMAARTEVRPSENDRLVFAGQLIRGKGVETFLRAAALQDCPAPIDIVGDGNLRAHLEALSAQLGLSERVVFHGWQAEPEAFMARARALVAPAFWFEPYGLTVAEAAAMGVPSVVTDHGGLPEIAGDRGGILVPPGNTHALAVALDMAVNDPGRMDRKGASARARVLSVCAPRRVARAWKGLLEEAAS